MQLYFSIICSILKLGKYIYKIFYRISSYIYLHSRRQLAFLYSVNSFMEYISGTDTSFARRHCLLMADIDLTLSSATVVSALRLIETS